MMSQGHKGLRRMSMHISSVLQFQKPMKIQSGICFLKKSHAFKSVRQMSIITNLANFIMLNQQDCSWLVSV